MLGVVIRDYRLGWRAGLKKVNKQWPLYNYLYFFIMPFINLDSSKNISIYFICMLPLMGTILLARIYPCQLSKTLYLCPLDKKERSAYIYMGYWVRVFFSVAIFASVGILLLLVYQANLEWVLLILCMQILFSLSTNLYLASAFRKPDFEKKQKMKGYSTWYLVAHFVGLLMLLVLFGVIEELQEIPRLGERISFGIFILIQSLITAKLMVGYGPKILSVALKYELVYQ